MCMEYAVALHDTAVEGHNSLGKVGGSVCSTTYLVQLHRLLCCCRPWDEMTKHVTLLLAEVRIQSNLPH